MSETLLSALYDIDLSFKSDRSEPMSHHGGMLDRKAVGAPLGTLRRFSGFSRSYSASSTADCDCSMPSLYRPSCRTDSAECVQLLLEAAAAAMAAASQDQQQPKPTSQTNPARYKTELCRPFEESGTCKYGDKCQFAHGLRELRNLSRHPKYKTERCRTFHTIGYCPYGSRCHFIHNAEERRAARSHPAQERPALFHSVSFAGFPGRNRSRTPSPPAVSVAPEEDDEVVEEDAFAGHNLRCLLGALAIGGPNAKFPPHTLRTLSQSPGLDSSPPSPPESISDPELYSRSPGSGSGASSPSLEFGRRLPIFSRLSITDD